MYLLPRPWQKNFNCRLTLAALLPAVFFVALLLAACGSSAWNLSIDEKPQYTATVTGIVQDSLRTGFVGLSGAIVSASTPTPVTTTTGPDGSFRLQVTHGEESLSFTLTAAKTCYQTAPAQSITVTRGGSYNAKAIVLTPVPKPTDNARFDLNPNADGSTYTLVVKCGVRKITPHEFRGDNRGTSNRLFNKLGTNSNQRVTVIKLPESLIRIEDYAFAGHHRMSRELTIPPTVEYIGIRAFANLSSQSSSSEQWVRLNFAPNSKLRFIGQKAFFNAKIQQFPQLPQSLEELQLGAFENVTHKPVSNFTIPDNVRQLGNSVFITTSGGVFQSFRGTLTIKSPHLVRTPVRRAAIKTGRLGNSIFSRAGTSTLFTQIILHKTVFDSYSQADLNAIFGTGGRYIDLADRTTELTP